MRWRLATESAAMRSGTPVAIVSEVSAASTGLDRRLDHARALGQRPLLGGGPRLVGRLLYRDTQLRAVLRDQARGGAHHRLLRGTCQGRVRDVSETCQRLSETVRDCQRLSAGRVRGVAMGAAESKESG